MELARVPLRVLREHGYNALVEAVIANALEQGISEINEELDVDYSLVWSETFEGDEFWSLIHRGEFEDAISAYPEYEDYFITEIIPEKDYSITSGGLLK
jgi:hypothetical protein